MTVGNPVFGVLLHVAWRGGHKSCCLLTVLLESLSLWPCSCRKQWNKLPTTFCCFLLSVPKLPCMKDGEKISGCWLSSSNLSIFPFLSFSYPWKLSSVKCFNILILWFIFPCTLRSAFWFRFHLTKVFPNSLLLDLHKLLDL